MGSPYYYTQGEFWGGATASRVMYMILAILPFTGFLGLDHLYLHSPGTFLLKLIFNVLTLGYWYFYDAIQAIYNESEGISANGLSIPWFGPSGLGAGAFKGEGVKDAPQSSLTFMGYVLAAMFVPFGLDYLIAGDYLGAVWKYLSLFMFGIGFIFGIINVYKIFFKPAEVFCEGTYRYFPFTLASDATNPAVEFTTKVGCPARPEGGSGAASFFEFFKGVSKALNRIPVVGPKMAAPIDAAVATVETATETVKATMQTATAAVDTVTKEIPAAVQTVTKIADVVTPQAILKDVKPLVGGFAPESSVSPVLIFTLGLVFIASAFVTIRGALGRLKTWVAEMPPVPEPAGAAELEENAQHTSDVGDLPPRAPEPGFF